jgi:hypothetical protein
VQIQQLEIEHERIRLDPALLLVYERCTSPAAERSPGFDAGR